jgi:hypothetical protein
MSAPNPEDHRWSDPHYRRFISESLTRLTNLLERWRLRDPYVKTGSFLFGVGVGLYIGLALLCLTGFPMSSLVFRLTGIGGLAALFLGSFILRCNGHPK